MNYILHDYNPRCGRVFAEITSVRGRMLGCAAGLGAAAVEVVVFGLALCG